MFTITTPSGADFRIDTLAERPDLKSRLDEIALASWPPFIAADEASVRCWDDLITAAPALQFAISDIKSGVTVGAGHATPSRWDGLFDSLPAGWDQVLEEGLSLVQDGVVCSSASALSIVVDPASRGVGLGEVGIEAMRRLISLAGFSRLIAPVRPNRKHLYPLIPMEHYVGWRMEDGLRFDPWVRCHERFGARVLKVAPESMRVDGDASLWHLWTGLDMPGEGEYVVPGGLVPVVLDSAGVGTYVEPNVWMEHPLATEEDRA